MVGLEPRDSVEVPKWVLPFVIPTLLGILAFFRAEYRTSENATAIVRMQDSHAEEVRILRAEIDRQRRVNDWLCTQRERDNQESGHTRAGTCPN
jgi:hypothetical protein